MGAWGNQPWENDSAANWFGDLFDHTKLAREVEKGLRLDAEEEPEVVRAAAYLVLLLGRAYIWPIGDINKHRALAAKKLREILETGDYEGDGEFTRQVQQEIAQLEAKSG